MPAPRAVSVIFETLLKIMVDNQAGVVGRVDAEFLHDYRVAVRRTRSALSLFGSVLPPVMSRRGRRFFSDLGRRTNVARDLDVLLLELPGYAEDLPDDHSAGLVSLQRKLEQQAAREYAAIGRWLTGKTYQRSLESWRRDVSLLGVPSATADELVIDELAAAAIMKAASKAFKQAEKLDGKKPDKVIHRMRIRFKKLRYALEFSRSLSAGGEIESFIAALKKLQDKLGVYQDLVVHQEWFTRLSGASSSDAELGAAADWLVAVARGRQGRLRDEIRDSVPDLLGGFRLELERALESLGKLG
ncbi:MAG: CHAD domain-containing protein [bacterium]|nr:CHAD domain-containing protein [bacterium]